MASDKKFVEFVVDQLSNVPEIRSRAMFGEYAVYSGNKLFGLICDNQLFIKPTDAGREFIKEVVEAPPYPGAKNSFLIGEKIDDRDWLTQLAMVTTEALPKPKPKKKKKRTTKNK